MNESVETIISGAEIPSIPDVLQKILILADDPDSSTRDLEELVLREPGLVTHLLKTVNSAFYSSRENITSVNRAIVMLGFLAVKSIASGLALIDAFNNIPGLNKKYVMTVWQHSLTCAGLIKVISGDEPRPKQDDLFLSAMVQEVGHLILAQNFQESYAELTDKEPFPPVEEERDHFDTDHAEIGALLLKKWKFPARITELVKYHHQPESYSGETTDIISLEVCCNISEKEEGITEFLKREKNCVDRSLLHKLSEVGWNWDKIKENSDMLIQSVDLARQIIPGR